MTAEETKAFKGRGWLLNKGTETFSARVVTGNGKVTAEQVQAKVRNWGFLLRRFPDDPRFSDRLRISMGTDEEMDELLGYL